MATKKRRCASCREYFSADEMRTVGIQAFCSDECVYNVSNTVRATDKRSSVGNRGKPAGSAGSSRMDPKIREQVFKRSGGACEARTPTCRPSVHAGHHVHHRLPRSGGGSDEPENLLLCCMDAHRYIHNHPAESYEKGWLIRRGK